MRRSAALVGVLAALLLAGCAASDGENASGAVRELVAALGRGDGAAACERLSEAGVAELLLVAVEQRAGGHDLAPALPGTCARVAERLATGAELEGLRRARVLRTLVEGDRATVETTAGAYEAEEVDGRWTVARIDPLARTLRTGRPPRRPVLLSIVRPRFAAPALGATVAHRTTASTLDVIGTLDPPGARLRARPISGASVEAIEAGDGRFRIRLRLRPGTNDLVLQATAPGRERETLGVRVLRD